MGLKPIKSTKASHPVEAVLSNTEILAISDPVTNGSHWFIEGMI